MSERSERHRRDAFDGGWLDRHDKPAGRIFCEHEPTDIWKFKQAGYGAYQAEKSIDVGFADVRRRLERDSNDRVRLLVSERCQHTIRMLC